MLWTVGRCTSDDTALQKKPPLCPFKSGRISVRLPHLPFLISRGTGGALLLLLSIETKHYLTALLFRNKGDLEDGSTVSAPTPPFLSSSPS
ncbi:hypothetical protein MATL_G00058320 [Megalops atlanticus]|uniref:Uncharacterized protein n=1 Tax=Megalops atlanticus TaxID=7932 RepID=A0A9D3Q7G5_MEGAT|nr:hypothetical protein MATL_G00058320 [Megalops atlanticus]